MRKAHAAQDQGLARLVAVGLLVAVLLGTCGTRHPPETPDLAAIRPVPLAAGGRLHVVATTTIASDVVGRVGGDRIDLTTLMALGADPHTYVATPADSAAVHDADVLFSSGAGLEEGMSELNLDSGGAVHIRLSDNLMLLPAAGGSADEVDPHVWLDVQNVVIWVGTVCQVLVALDPASASTYQTNAATYGQELEALDAWVVEQTATVPQDKRRLVTNHETLGYFAHRYGLTLVGAVYPLSPSAEPSAQNLAALEEAIRKYGLSVLFTEGTVSPVLADQVARDTGVRLVSLYTESLGPAGSGADTYLGLMRYDVHAIMAALK